MSSTASSAPSASLSAGFSAADIAAAAERIAGQAVVTPLLSSDVLDARIGGRVLLKPEALQRTGSFKFRGAFNRLSMIPEAERKGGVVACSSGNHAQGVAAAAALLGMPAVIVMPRDAPAMKIARTRALGAEVVLYDRLTEDREAIARTIAAERRATFVHPYDDFGVMAGQGTVGLEVAAECRRLAIVPDQAMAPASGGGLVAGLSTALTDAFPAVAVYAVEPEGFDDHVRSLESGARQTNERLGGSLCDALMSNAPGEKTFPVNRRTLAGAVAVSDAEALAAVAFAFRELKLVLEPGGAVALAALLTGRIDGRSRTSVVVLSGGNVDEAVLARALAENPA
jgi:threonine dehydratase